MLSVEIETPAGAVHRWDGADKDPANRPTGIEFSTALGEGFAGGSCILRRRTDIDWPDLALLATVRVVDGEGAIAYEGRLAKTPRQVDSSGHQIRVEMQGWMSHATDRAFTRIFVDRDISRWQSPPAARMAALYSAGFLRINGPEAESDDADPTLAVHVRDEVNAIAEEVGEGWYDAGSAGIGDLYYEWQGRRVGTAATWASAVALTNADDGSGAVSPGDLLTGSTSGSGYLSAAVGLSPPYRYAILNLFNSGVEALTKDRRMEFSKLAVIGDSGVTLRGDAPGGVYASDVIRNIAADFCPMLDTSGVEDTDYAIAQLAFHDPVFPHDAFRVVNNFHLCFPGDTPILAAGGIKRAREIEVGDLIITHNGNPSTVKAIARRPNAERMVAITPWNGERIDLTPNHEVFTQRGWVRADELGASDLVTMPVREIKDTISELSTKVTRREGQTGGRQAKGGGVPVPLNRETGFTFGYYLAEGTVIEKDGSPSGLTFSRHRDEKDYAARAIAAIEPWITSHRQSSRAGTLTEMDTVYGAAIARVVAEHFGRTDRKRVPDWVFDAGEDFTRGLVLGYLAGDGSKVYGHKGSEYDNPTVSACSICPAILAQIRDLAASLGYGWGGLRFRPGGTRNGSECRDTWTVYWNGSAARKLRADLGLAPPATKGRPTTERYVIRDGRVWMQLRKIERVEAADEVWDLEVDHADHSFRTAHFAISNCELAVWENRRLTFAQSSLADYQWQFRPGEYGQGSGLEGPDAEMLRNGLAITFTDYSGATRFITPDDRDELRETSETNPANQLGIDKWGEPFSIPFVCTEEDAVQIGAAQLAELNRPRAAGTVNAGRTVLDAAGNSQPSYKVRANQSAILANHPADFPRLIASTTYSHDSGTLTVGVERPTDNLSAMFTRAQDRLSTVGL